MINRRILRIKTMQSIYAFMVGKEANQELAKSNLKDQFEPDYMAKVPEDRGLLRKEEGIAQSRFSSWIKDPESLNDAEVSDKVANAVSTTIGSYNDAAKKDVAAIRKKLFLEIENIYSTYLLILEIASELQIISSNHFDEKKNNLGANKAIELLGKDAEFQQEINNRGISWQEHIVILRKFFKNSVIPDPEFCVYQDLTNPGFEEDKEIVLHILRKLVFEEGILFSHLEEIDLYWVENKNILKGMIKKTIRDLEENSDKNNLIDLSSNWNEDKEFISTLYDKSIELERESFGVIEQKAQNWDTDRLALIDKIIITMGLCEMLSFPSIPVKVSINEYIDISKSYSTPKSKQFINGLLDSISKDYNNSGKIKKSGKGLIDTK